MSVLQGQLLHGTYCRASWYDKERTAGPAGTTRNVLQGQLVRHGTYCRASWYMNLLQGLVRHATSTHVHCTNSMYVSKKFEGADVCVHMHVCVSYYSQR